MHPLIATGSRALVFVVSIYLLLLGLGALVRPETAKRFLGGHATTLPLHLIELLLRVLAGSAFVFIAPRMAVSPIVLAFGWVLSGTSLILGLVQWRLQQRFAAWSVPRATQHMSLIGIGAIAGGIAVITALFLQSAAG